MSTDKPKAQPVVIWENHAENLHRRYVRGTLPAGYEIVERVVRVPFTETDYGVVKIWDRFIYVKRIRSALAPALEIDAMWESVSYKELPRVKEGMMVVVPLGARDKSIEHVTVKVGHVAIGLYDLQQFTVTYLGSETVAAQQATFYSIHRDIQLLTLDKV